MCLIIKLLLEKNNNINNSLNNIFTWYEILPYIFLHFNNWIFCHPGTLVGVSSFTMLLIIFKSKPEASEITLLWEGLLFKNSINFVYIIKK